MQSPQLAASRALHVVWYPEAETTAISQADGGAYATGAMRQLDRMTWPRPVPIAMWRGEYADIKERIRRTGRLDTDALYEPTSGDGYGAFCGRHGRYLFDHEWRGGAYVYRPEERPPDAAAEARRAQYRAKVEREQEAHEAAQRARQLEKQRQADAEWEAAKPREPAWEPPTALLEAQRWWSERNAQYATQAFHYVSPCKGGVIQTDGVTVTFTTGQGQWVPYVIAVSIWSGGG